MGKSVQGILLKYDKRIADGVIVVSIGADKMMQSDTPEDTYIKITIIGYSEGHVELLALALEGELIELLALG